MDTTHLARKSLYPKNPPRHLQLMAVNPTIGGRRQTEIDSHFCAREYPHAAKLSPGLWSRKGGTLVALPPVIPGTLVAKY